MSDKIRLSELVAARAGIPKSDGVPGVIRHSLHARAAEGIIATHNAADALIEIVQATVAFMECDTMYDLELARVKLAKLLVGAGLLEGVES